MVRHFYFILFTVFGWNSLADNDTCDTSPPAKKEPESRCRRKQFTLLKNKLYKCLMRTEINSVHLFDLRHTFLFTKIPPQLL